MKFAGYKNVILSGGLNVYIADKKIRNMNNQELLEIAKAFNDCGEFKSCKKCPCDGILCGHNEFSEARDSFICEIGKRFATINVD